MAPSVHIPEDLLGRVDEHLDQMKAKTTARLTRSDAFRDLLSRGLGQEAKDVFDPTYGRLPFLDVPFIPTEGESAWMPTPTTLYTFFGDRIPRVDPSNLIFLEPGRTIKLATRPQGVPGRLLSLIYEPCRDDGRSLVIDNLQIDGAPDLLPYRGHHPLDAWTADRFENFENPDLRGDYVLAWPNRAYAIVWSTAARELAFTLSLRIRTPS